ncbi:unnamed protein product [Aphanomyces euteiches]
MTASLLMAMTSATSLSPRQVHDIYETARQCVDTLISYANLNHGPIHWTLDSTHGDYRLFKGSEPAPFTKSNSSGLYCSSMDINATLDEVMEHFRTDTTEKAQQLVHRVGRGAVDSVNLARLPPPCNSSIEDVIVKWNLGKNPFNGLARKRDMCVVECDYSFEVNGKRGWVRARHSIKVDSCPDLEATMGYIRMEDRGSGHVFIESDRAGCLHAFHINHMDLRGHPANLLAHVCIKNCCASLKDLDRFLRENRLSRGPWLDPRHYESHDAVDACSRCYSNFSLFRRKTNCQKCGQVVCSSCNQSWHVKLNNEVTKRHACTVCSLKPPPTAVKDADNRPSEFAWLSQSLVSQANTASASSYIEIAAGHDSRDGLYYVL